MKVFIPDAWPTSDVVIICGLKSPGDDVPFAELDALYTYILHEALKVKYALKNLSFLVVPVHEGNKLGSTPHSLASLLSLSLGQVHLTLSEFYSLLNVPLAEASNQDIRVLHASLGDFLTDRSRAGSHFIEVGKIHVEISRCWLQRPLETSDCAGVEANAFANHLAEASVTVELTQELYQFDLRVWVKTHTKQAILEGHSFTSGKFLYGKYHLSK